jgi:uncharacterized protein YjbJ (UPF0337 family)
MAKWGETRSGADRRSRDQFGKFFHHRTLVMKWYQLADDWKQFTSMVKERWGKLTDDDLMTFGGSSQQLTSLLQQKYGYAKEQAEKEINEFSTAASR